MKEKLVKIWGTLRPEQRKKSIIAGVLLVLTIIAFGIYKSTRGSAPPPPPSAKREINLGAGDKDVLEKSLYNESTKVIDDMKTQMEDLQKQLKAVQETKEAPSLPAAHRHAYQGSVRSYGEGEGAPGSAASHAGSWRIHAASPSRRSAVAIADATAWYPACPCRRRCNSSQAGDLRGYQGCLPG